MPRKTDAAVMYTPKEFKQTVEESQEINTDQELTGATMGATIETLMDCTEVVPESTIVSSNRHAIPIPVGAIFNVTELNQFADLIENLGPHCIQGITRDKGELHVEFQFD